MKLESLKKDKFEPFKQNEIQNKMKIVGGEPQATNFRNDRYHGTDTIDTATFGDPDKDKSLPDFTLENGRPGAVDYSKGPNIPNLSMY